MYAVIKDSGKQFKVKPGDRIWVDLKPDIADGETIEFNEVLMFSKDGVAEVGAPLLPNVKVVGNVKGIKKAKKVITMKFRRRKDSRTKRGHRQKYTEVNIKEIVHS